jgi:hypothetical protein
MGSGTKKRPKITVPSQAFLPHEAFPKPLLAFLHVELKGSHLLSPNPLLKLMALFI